MKKALKKSLRTCENGHQFRKSSSCPTCPHCEKLKKPDTGFLSELYAPARRALENANILTIERLSAFKEEDILKLHGMGSSSIPILRNALRKAGLKFNSK